MDHTGSMAKSVELLYDKAKKYAETNAELFALNAVDKTSDLLSSIAASVLIVMVIAMFALFLSFGLSFYIGNLLDAYYLGFLVVSACYLVAAILLYLFKDTLIKLPIANLFISKLLKSKHPDSGYFHQFKDTNHEAA